MLLLRRKLVPVLVVLGCFVLLDLYLVSGPNETHRSGAEDDNVPSASLSLKHLKEQVSKADISPEVVSSIKAVRDDLQKWNVSTLSDEEITATESKLTVTTLLG